MYCRCAVCTSTFLSWGSPLFFRGLIDTTGTPNSRSSSIRSISMPFFFARSSMVRATTTGMRRSIICEQNNRLRFRLLASATSTTIWGCTKASTFINTLYDTHSSALRGYRLYVPGKSIKFAVIPGSSTHVPVFLSTVTPGKLPTFWFKPVIALNSEVFPLLGLPTNAMFNKGFSMFTNKVANVNR